MNICKKKLRSAYYVFLIVSIIIYIIPGKFKMAVYGLNYLGWLTIVVAILTILMFLWLLILDIKNKNFKALFKRIIVFILALLVCVIYSYYDQARNENLTKEELIEILGD